MLVNLALLVAETDRRTTILAAAEVFPVKAMEEEEEAARAIAWRRYRQHHRRHLLYIVGTKI